MKGIELTYGMILVVSLFLIGLGFFIGNQYGTKRMLAAFEGFESQREREGEEEEYSQSCPEPDSSKWVLKATVPPCPPMPDMSKYMLKAECPPQPDMSKYVLKSSVPSCPPCISTCSKPCKIGECPPCPRPRCPTVQCPEPKACPACPSVSCPPCEQPQVKCTAAYDNGGRVRPMLANTNSFGF
jgi:hypothetical protein